MKKKNQENTTKYYNVLLRKKKNKLKCEKIGISSAPFLKHFFLLVQNFYVRWHLYMRKGNIYNKKRFGL